MEMFRHVIHDGSGQVLSWEASQSISSLFFIFVVHFCLLQSCQLLFLMDMFSVFIRSNVLLSLDQSNETMLLPFLFHICFLFFSGGYVCMCMFHWFLSVACCYSCFDFSSIIFMPCFH